MFRDFTYIDDIINGIYLCQDYNLDGENKFKLFNIGSGNPISLLEFVNTLESCLNKTAISTFKELQPGDVYKTYADIEDISKLTGYKPETSLKEGLQKFTNWFMEFYG